MASNVSVGLAAAAGVAAVAAGVAGLLGVRAQKKKTDAAEAAAIEARTRAAVEVKAAQDAKTKAETDAKEAQKIAAAASLRAAAARADFDRLTLKPAEAKRDLACAPSFGITGGGPPARIVALASAFPPNTYAQSQYLAAFLRNHPGINAKDQDFVERVWAGTGFDTCSSYLPEDMLFKKMKRSEYVPYIKKSLKDMALRSANEALTQWGGDRNTITHIVFGTMTGSIHAPTMDRELALELKLPVPIKCLNIEGMGCLTGYRCLGLASDIARADPSHVVLLIVCDIRSALGNQLSAFDPAKGIDKSNVIVSSLFRDSGASAIITSQHAAELPKMSGAPPTKPLYEIVEHRSALLPETFDRVKYEERDDAVIHLYIAKELPGDIKKALPAQVRALLAPHGLTTADCSFSVHTGGPKVLNYVAEGLEVPEARMAASWYTMKKYGNLSGSSNLVVLDQWRKLPATVKSEPKQYVVCMSFGPGVGMELVLLKVTSPEVPGYQVA